MTQATSNTSVAPGLAQLRSVCVRALFLVLFFTLAANDTAFAQQIGDCVTVQATNPAGVPVHRRAENSFTGQRLPDRSVAEVLEVDSDQHWFRLQGHDSVEGWVVEKYVGSVVPCDATSPEILETIRVGSWNLEHFTTGKARGFPEFQGLDALPARTDDDMEFIAEIIADLQFSILVLQEINGEDRLDEHGEEIQGSEELDELVAALGDHYQYEIAATGHSQRIAILWDSEIAFLNWTCEPSLSNPRVNGKRLFDRQPLLGYFTLFVDGQEMNDLAVIGVHLASGQGLTANHDQAMDAIDEWIENTRSAGDCLPPNEFDVLITGDFNANRFDSRVEDFWDEMEADGYNVLADDPSYPATRLSGNPPAQRTSKIDYIIISSGSGGLDGDEVVMATARVHDDLVEATGGGLAFRTRASDHIPLSIEVRVTTDHD